MVCNHVLLLFRVTGFNWFGDLLFMVPPMWRRASSKLEWGDPSNPSNPTDEAIYTSMFTFFNFFFMNPFL